MSPTFTMKRFPFFSLIALMFVAATLVRAEPVAPTPAPAWTLQDLDGQAVSSDQFKGKVLVIDFWATWCGPCVQEIPGYIALQNKYGKDGLVIIGVSLDRTGPEKVKKFVQQKGMNFVVVMGDEKIAEAFGGFEAIPTTFVIDRSGIMRSKKVGAEETAVFEKTLLPYLR